MVMLTQTVVVVAMVMTRRTFIIEVSTRLVMVRIGSDGIIALAMVVVVAVRTFIIEVSTGAWARFCNVLVRVTEA